ncbi:hypothetical protein ACH4RA_21200 [Streptomyces smyrnaeus]|uniref:Uncharacterized protein n=1 Tax=Streptomyces smyrnaeus TaxID=1387713 RepID=A0ABS3XQ97_9ACTN|nr:MULTISPECIES: hypothetical protein [Streptomyces]MBO8197256.1 hypothetical protein [Streptomyces smyrnaeus]MBQ0862761.1 hypothetical protein [Streptomyces sp. RK75]MBQ1119228.1 hypothetical protein [Streptomyces sp. B15]MBQ1162993.1 hypothetical protein [Streptomyces sp. A73]
MSDQTPMPSQAEGERDNGFAETRSMLPDERRKAEHPDCPRTTPSQAEGEREEDAG